PVCSEWFPNSDRPERLRVSETRRVCDRHVRALPIPDRDTRCRAESAPMRTGQGSLADAVPSGVCSYMYLRQSHFSEGFFLFDTIFSSADATRFVRVSLFFASTIHVTYSRWLVKESLSKNTFASGCFESTAARSFGGCTTRLVRSTTNVPSASWISSEARFF